MWSDNESEIDLLRFEYLSVAVSRIITTESLLPTTVGVFGDWGSGKSTLLGMIRSRVSADKEALCLGFNGWLFEGHEDAKTALMGTILDAIEESVQAQKSPPQKAIELLDRLRKRVNWLQLMMLSGRYVAPVLLGQPHLSALAAGHDVAVSIYNAVKESEKGKRLTPEDIRALLNAAPAGAENHRKDIRDFRNDFGDLLKQSGVRKLIVFIDDLDRCLPDTIIETLEAIKLFLFVPGTAFVIGADERLIQYAVRNRFPELPGTETEIGRDYLEKLVQIPLRIPPLNGGEIHSYINLLFAQLRLDTTGYTRVCAHVASFSAADLSALPFDIVAAQQLLPRDSALPLLVEDLDFASQIAPILAPGMGGNPRRTKRFLNSLLLRLDLGTARGLDLRRQVMAKLMLLEYLKPEFFKQLAKLQANQTGKPEELQYAEDLLRVEEHPEVSEAESPESQARITKDRRVERAEGKQGVSTPQPPPKKEIPAEAQSWLADEWMRTWLLSHPTLGAIDLQPYFYIAHDTIGPISVAAQRLSPRAQQVLKRLVDQKQLTRKMGLDDSRSLVAADAAAVFEHLALRVRQAETLNDKQAPHHVLFELMTTRPELLTQLVILLDSLPETKITFAIPVKLYEVAKGTPATGAAQTLLTKWAASRAEALANAAQQAINRKWD